MPHVSFSLVSLNTLRRQIISTCAQMSTCRHKDFLLHSFLLPLIFPSHRTFPLHARCLSPALIVKVSPRPSTRRSLLSSRDFLTLISVSVFLSLSLTSCPLTLWVSPLTVSLPQSHIRPAFLFSRAHVRAVSCNSVVTLPVISNSLCTALSVSRPPLVNSASFDNVVDVDNPVMFVVVGLIHHKGK